MITVSYFIFTIFEIKHLAKFLRIVRISLKYQVYQSNVKFLTTQFVMHPSESVASFELYTGIDKKVETRNMRQIISSLLAQ